MKVNPLILAVPLGILIVVVIIFMAIISVSTIARIRYEGAQMRYSAEVLSQAYRQFQVGMSQAEVEAIAREVAWRRYACPQYETWSRDVYIFGSRDLDLAAMLIMTYKIENGESLLSDIGGFEMYMLGSVTNGCDAENIQ